MFASICLRVLSRIQRGGARLVTDFTPKPPELQATFERQHRYCRQCSAFLTVSETCAELRVSKPTVFRLLREGTLPSVLLGSRTRRIPRSAVEELVKRAKSGGGQ